jgi:1-acyl-sn-glycerol-3-phosphate acyltransferase
LSVAAGSGGVLPEGDDDVVAEGLELAAGVAGLAASVGVPGVPVRSKVPVAGGGIVEQVPVALCPPRDFRRLFRVLG